MFRTSTVTERSRSLYTSNTDNSEQRDWMWVVYLPSEEVCPQFCLTTQIFKKKKVKSRFPSHIVRPLFHDHRHIKVWCAEYHAWPYSSIGTNFYRTGRPWVFFGVVVPEKKEPVKKLFGSLLEPGQISYTQPSRQGKGLPLWILLSAGVFHVCLLSFPFMFFSWDQVLVSKCL